jgi:pimeloyl-ACP methyl ester carboxylesterase
MKKLVGLLFLALLVLVQPASAQGMIGQWQGTLHAGQDLRIALKISKAANGSLAGTLYSIDQGGAFPISSASLENSVLTFAVTQVGGSYKGTVSTDGKSIKGTWTQGSPLSLDFELATGKTAWAMPSSADTSPLPLYKHLVEIGSGRRLNLVCMGKGSPTVVFMQGLGGNFADWRKVRGPVGAFTRECFYDRAGLGFSDPSEKPSTAENAASDFRALLRAAGIGDRVVLVGASLGGLFATYYTDKFGSDVAGLVLVDPSFPGQFDYAVSAQDKKIIEDDGDHFAALMQTCRKLAEDGSLSKGDSHDCFYPPRDLTPEDAEYVTQQFGRPSYYATMLSEFDGLRQKKEGDSLEDNVDADQEARIQRTFGNLPLVVLTGGLMSKAMTISEAGKSAAQGVWERGHDKLAHRSTRGESVIIPDSGHRIDLEKPEAVINAIRKVVLEVRR